MIGLATLTLPALALVQSFWALGDPGSGVRTLVWEGTPDGWTHGLGERGLLAESPLIDPGFEWDELVVSWNVQTPRGVGVRIDVEPWIATGWSGSYTMGLWSSDPARAVRSSVRGQADELGEVQTDTLVLSGRARRVRLRLTYSGREAPKLELLALSFRDSRAVRRRAEPNRRAWGRTLDVPRRAQMSYPNGGVLCSPTCVSMVLAHWALRLRSPELDRDVPEVVKGIYDPVWGGTGNWPFNTAYAGSLPGLKAFVARLSDVSEIEGWVARGVPVIASVSYDYLQGKVIRSGDDGHLVVVVGFTESGDPVFNDPGRSVVRRVYERRHFERAWAQSGRTVYLILPEAMPIGLP